MRAQPKDHRKSYPVETSLRGCVPSEKKIQHPLLGEVDPETGPSMLEEHERKLIFAEDDEPVPEEIIFPAPEPLPEAPSLRRIARRILAGGLRQLARLADKLDEDE